MVIEKGWWHSKWNILYLLVGKLEKKCVFENRGSYLRMHVWNSGRHFIFSVEKFIFQNFPDFPIILFEGLLMVLSLIFINLANYFKIIGPWNFFYANHRILNRCEQVYTSPRKDESFFILSFRLRGMVWQSSWYFK